MKTRLKKYLVAFKQAFLNEFSSVKLAITLFIFIAIATLVGTILPEEPMVGASELVNKYGLKKYHFLKSLGLTDVFHSWWYLALLTSLGINLTVASFLRVFPKWRLAFLWPTELKEENIKKLPIYCELNLKNSLTLETVQQALKKKNFGTKAINGMLVAMKGGWHRLGASVTHIGILVLLIGSAISILTGFNGMAQLSEKEGFYIADLGQTNTQIKSSEPENWLVPLSKMPLWFGRVPPYLIKVNKTWRVNYKEGQPKQWYTDLSVFDQNKKEIKRKTIFVNDPLEFMGLDVYQSNWGRFANLSFNDEQLTVPLENFKGEEIIFLPLSNELGLKLQVTRKDQFSDFLEIYSVSQPNSKNKYLGHVEKNNSLQLGPLLIKYFGSQTLTGLQFKSNPGDKLIYPGFFFIILGVFIAFGSKKQIWVALNPSDNKIIIGGSSDRAKGKFFEEFKTLIQDISKGK